MYPRAVRGSAACLVIVALLAAVRAAPAGGAALAKDAGANEAKPRAAAAPRSEQLDKAAITAAKDRARARLPRPNREAGDACNTRYAPAFGPADPARTAPVVAAAAECLRAAGYLGLAIRLWQVLVSDFPRAREAALAERELGPAWEAAGNFYDAGRWHRSYATKYSGERDARERLIRAICIFRQLGATDLAAASFSDLEHRAPRGPKPDPATVCAGVNPLGAGGPDGGA
jgi:hypothetical protein